MIRFRTLAVVVVVGFTVLAARMSAQQPAAAAAFPSIVIFHDDVSLDQFAAGYRADDRAVANAAAWNYVHSGVAGYVQVLERLHAFRADHIYSASVRGFAARLTARQIALLERDPAVRYIEADGVMSIIAQTTPWGITKIGAAGKSDVTNVNVYIIDTGLDVTHPDLNVVGHVNFASGPNNDCNGHGTHVGGTVAAKNNDTHVVGVASGAPMRGVKVLGCGGSGSTSGVIKGVDWVTANRILPAVANMSLGGGASNALDDAIRKSVAAGVFYSVAAGNDGADACTKSPARAGAGIDNGIMTVAALDSNDAEPSWSNFGSCVDIWAPGVSILSTWKSGGTKTASGTSMAAPHVGGTGARALSMGAASLPTDVEASLRSNSVATGTTSKDGDAITRVNAVPY